MLTFILVSITPEGRPQVTRTCGGFYGYARRAAGVISVVALRENGEVAWTRPLSDIEAHAARRMDKTKSTASIEEVLED